MPRPRNIERKVEKKIYMPESLEARMIVKLWDPIMGCIPLGAFSELACRAITKELDSMETPNVQS